jgi:hypothetical protein
MTIAYLTSRAARTFIVAVACSCTLWLMPPAAAADTSAARREIAGDYAAVDKALTHRDVDGALAFCTPDFVVVQFRVTTKLAVERSEGRQQLTQARWAQSHTKIVKFSVRGDKATATIVQHMRFEGPVNGLLEVTDSTESDSDLWVRIGGAWRLKKTSVLTQKTFLSAP